MRSLFRAAFLLLGLVTLTIVAVAASVLSNRDPRKASADNIQLDISASSGSASCTPASKCDFAPGSKVTLLISAPDGGIPSTGYTGYEAVLQFSGALNLNQGAQNPPVTKWPDCQYQVQDLTQVQAGRYRVACFTGIFAPPVVHYTGPLANVSFTCKTGQAAITLVGGIGESGYINGNPNNPVLVYSYIKASETLTINCGTQANSTPTGTSSATATPAATTSPTATPQAVGGVSLDPGAQLSPERSASDRSAALPFAALALGGVSGAAGAVWLARRRLAR